tara:strand:- start:28 stop:294 length:267 start_codon:yes stop_codon:yes gene_type:complete
MSNNQIDVNKLNQEYEEEIRQNIISNKTVKISLTLNQFNKVRFAISERLQTILFENDDKLPQSKDYLYSEYQCLKRVYSNFKKLGENK